jgi:hypothetical protein
MLEMQYNSSNEGERVKSHGYRDSKIVNGLTKYVVTTTIFPYIEVFFNFFFFWYFLRGGGDRIWIML